MTWKNEPQRHALASEGVKTSFGKSKYRDMKEQLSRDPDVEEYVDIKPPKELRNIYWNNFLNEKKEIKKCIKLFWWCNANDEWEWFPFDKYIEKTKQRLYSLIYFQCERKPKLVVDIVHDYLDQKGYDSIEDMGFSETLPSDIYFRDYRLSKVYVKLDQAKNLTEKIIAVDESIHVEHAEGNIWEISSIPELRHQFEDRYL